MSAAISNRGDLGRSRASSGSSSCGSNGSGPDRRRRMARLVATILAVSCARRPGLGARRRSAIRPRRNAFARGRRLVGQTISQGRDGDKHGPRMAFKPGFLAPPGPLVLPCAMEPRLPPGVEVIPDVGLPTPAIFPETNGNWDIFRQRDWSPPELDQLAGANAAVFNPDAVPRSAPAVIRV